MRASAYNSGFDFLPIHAFVFPKHCTSRVSDCLWKPICKLLKPLNIRFAQSEIIAFPFYDRCWSGIGLVPGIQQWLVPENQILSHVFLSTATHLPDSHLDPDLTQRIKHRIRPNFQRQELMGKKIHDLVLATIPIAGFQELIKSGERSLYYAVPSVIAGDAECSAVSEVEGQASDDTEPEES